MNSLIKEIMTLIDQGQPFALATVMNSKGSTPRSVGAKMLVKMDGSTLGTVGGGKLEADVAKMALKMITEKRAAIQGFEFNGQDAASMDSICGGQVNVLIEYLNPDHPANKIVFEGLEHVLNDHSRAWLVTALDQETQSTCHSLVDSDGSIHGDCPQGLQIEEILETRVPRQIDLGKDMALVEPVNISGTVFIFGAGHVSRSLAEFTHAVGFWTVVLDDRAEYANRDRFPNADEIEVLASFEDCMQGFRIERESFIVIVTRGHLADLVVLKQALKTGAGYIGMIGSRRKCILIFEELRRLGYSEEAIQRVHAPIGIPIRAETPEEIGISIVAEMIQVRANLLV